MKTNPLRERRVKSVLSGRRKQVRDKTSEILLKDSRISELESLVKEKEAQLVEIGRGLIGAYKALYGGS